MLRRLGICMAMPNIQTRKPRRTFLQPHNSPNCSGQEHRTPSSASSEPRCVCNLGLSFVYAELQPQEHHKADAVARLQIPSETSGNCSVAIAAGLRTRFAESGIDPGTAHDPCAAETPASLTIDRTRGMRKQ
jgi:hypothetical protein